MQIYENGQIGNTGLGVSQTKDGTVVYTREKRNLYTSKIERHYKEHAMPHQRYSLAHDNPASGVAGRAQFEADITTLMASPDFEL